MLVALEVATLRSVTIVVDRFEVPVTFKVPPRTEEAFRVVILLVNMLDVPVVLRVAAKRLTTFILAAFPLV